MADKNNYPERMVFGLDIGTRSLVGSVGYMDRGKFNVVAHSVKEHETRAMMDGQIHDIRKVAESIEAVKRELEYQIDRKLENVCIAAAGRVLKTVTVHIDEERIDDTAVTDEEIYSLDLLGIEKAYEIMRNEYPDIEFYCVGYSVVKYYMNDYFINNLEGHKAKKIGADVLATFLPHEVVEGLYAAVEMAGLQVSSLTLEPIAAINVAIPENFRLLNIALVDVGAGTSDICITKDGSITAYGMIPHAGDEITEVIVQNCLVDFQTAEKIKIDAFSGSDVEYKDIMGLTHTVTAREVYDYYACVVENMTKEIAEKIKELNGGKSVSAVFVVGGGGKAYGFTQMLSEALAIQKDRVALRGEEVLGDVNFLIDGVKKDPLLVTPIGICINYYNQKNNFVTILVNDKRVKLYDNDKLTVVDAVMQAGITNLDFFPKRGDSLNFTYNQTQKSIRGELGEPAVITLNGKEANLNSKVEKNDKIYIEPSTKGTAGHYKVEQLPDYNTKLSITVNGINVECPRVVLANGKLVTGSYEICEGDEISIPEYYMLKQLMQFLDMDYTYKKITINGRACVEDEPVYAGFKLTIEDSMETFGSSVYDDEAKDLYEASKVKKETKEVNNMPKDKADLEALINESANTTDANISMKGEALTAKGDIPNEASYEQPQVKEQTSGPDVKKDTENEIIVVINRTPVKLKNKPKYIFVDILDVYPFDTSVAGGKEIVLTVNGENASFTTPIADGDILELYWRN